MSTSYASGTFTLASTFDHNNYHEASISLWCRSCSHYVFSKPRSLFSVSFLCLKHQLTATFLHLSLLPPMKHHSSPLSKLLLAYHINILKLWLILVLNFWHKTKKTTHFTTETNPQLFFTVCFLLKHMTTSKSSWGPLENTTHGESAAQHSGQVSTCCR